MTPVHTPTARVTHFPRATAIKMLYSRKRDTQEHTSYCLNSEAGVNSAQGIMRVCAKRKRQMGRRNDLARSAGLRAAATHGGLTVKSERQDELSLDRPVVPSQRICDANDFPNRGTSRRT
jgi:hypothetical protein